MDASKCCGAFVRGANVECDSRSRSSDGLNQACRVCGARYGHCDTFAETVVLAMVHGLLIGVERASICTLSRLELFQPLGEVRLVAT
jgi:hypothetical protein